MWMEVLFLRRPVGGRGAQFMQYQNVYLLIMKSKTRCAWCGQDEAYVSYHDEEWGVPVHDDRLLFEMLNLEGAQAGISWQIILKKRPNYRRLFDNFEPEVVAEYSDDYLQHLLQDPGIVRNRLKVYSVRTNAAAFLKVRREFGTFDRYIWQFTGGKPIINRWRTMQELPSKTPESDAMSKDLKRRGFKFVGSTICYAFMQAVGMVNDHTTDCFRYEALV
jgi:DNA-3-methyladenine glycosylase I